MDLLTPINLVQIVKKISKSNSKEKEDMKTYRIPFSVTCVVCVTIEAESKEQAIYEAYRELHISQYVGNGGNDKLIGVSSRNHSIEAGEDFEAMDDSIEEE